MTRSRLARERAAAAAQSSDGPWRSKLRLVGVVLICAKVALIPTIFDYTADVPFTVIKTLLSHALAYLLIGVIGGLFVQFGVSFFVRSWLHLPVAGFLVANIAATLFATDSLLALFGAHERMLGLGTVADDVLLYLAVVLLVRSRGEALAVATSILAGSLVVLGYEAVQISGRDPFAWLLDSAARPFSTIGNATSLAEYLTILTVGAATLAIFGGALPVAARLSLIVYSGLTLAGAVVTQTRSTVFGVLAAILVLAALTWSGHPARRARMISLVGSACAVVVLTGVLVATPLGVRFSSTVELSTELSTIAESDAGLRLEGAADTRAALYRIASDMVRDRPFLGYGPDNYASNLPKYRSEHEPYEVQDVMNSSAHSWIAQVAVTSGLLGLATFIAIPVVGLVLTLRRGFRPEAWAAVGMVAAFLGEGVTTVNALVTDQLFWIVIGTVAAVSSRAQGEAVQTGVHGVRDAGNAASRESGWRQVVAVLLAAICLIPAATTLNALNASHLAKASQVARLQGRSQQAVDLGIQSTSADAMRAQYWETLGLAFVSHDRMRDAAAAFQRASELAAYDVRYDGDLARALAELAQRGDGAAATNARSVAERVVRTDPNNPSAHYTRAFVMQVTGNLPEAVKSIEHAIALDRLNGSGFTNHPDMYVTGIQVLTAVQQPQAAIKMARAAIAKVPDTAVGVPIRVELSRALAANGQLTEALGEIDAALALQPANAAARQLRAQILQTLAE